MKRHYMMAICGALLLSYCGLVNAQSPVPGQPYQVPDGYTGYAAGTAISYGGYNYVIQPGGTMLLADQGTDSSAPAENQGSGQVYQIPDGYSGYAAGSVISYGGANYVLQSGGTMVLAAQGGGYDPGPDQVYQIPSGYSGYPVGSVITYGGSNYTIGLSGTMVLVNKTTYSSNYGPHSTGPGPGGHYPPNTGHPTGGRFPQQTMRSGGRRGR
jgi:hypothetical protein